MNADGKSAEVIVIGGGFTGLSAAYELARKGIAVTLLEKDDEIGGIAGGFNINGCCIDKCYHHFFRSDADLINLAEEIGFGSKLRYASAKTSVYLAGRFYALTSPLDLLRFKPLNLMDRFRLGMLILSAKRLSDWMPLESQTVEQWLVSRCGRQVYSVLWEPLLRAKFGSFTPEVSAVWFWNKLLLRGGSRDVAGREILGFINGGFAAFAQAVAERIQTLGGNVLKGIAVTGIFVENGCVRSVRTHKGDINADAVIATPALPIIADLLDGKVAQEYIDRLRRIRYLANVCLELELTEHLSDIYWLNINDPDVPFTGIIENTNFIPAENCANRHIVYLSRYLERQSEIYNMSAEQLLEYAVPYIKKIFTGFERSRISGYHKWAAPFAQPIIERHYSRLICPVETPVKGFYISTMAQVYPQDRGLNYAVKLGHQAAKTAAEYLAYYESGVKK